MSAAPAAVVAAASALVYYPRIESWMRTGARVQQAAIEAELARRERVEVQQFAAQACAAAAYKERAAKGALPPRRGLPAARKGVASAIKRWQGAIKNRP